jgi:hypothetical protein
VTGRDLPLVFVFGPVQLALCIWFLYRVLSWSESECLHIGSLANGRRRVCWHVHHRRYFALAWFAHQEECRVPAEANACCEFRRSSYLSSADIPKTDARIDVITEAVGAVSRIVSWPRCRLVWLTAIAPHAQDVCLGGPHEAPYRRQEGAGAHPHLAPTTHESVSG